MGKMDKRNFFRKEAIDHVKNKHYGAVCINTPLPYLIISIGLGVISICIIIFIFFAEFSEKYTIRGYLNSNKGITNVYPLQEGIITQCLTMQGNLVKKGEALFVINTNYETLSTHHKPDEFEQLQSRKSAIQKDIVYKKTHLKELKLLLDKKYIPLGTYQATYDEISALEQNIHLINMALIKYKQLKSYVIRAPVTGIISNVMYQTGQHVNTSKPLLNILPDKAHLIAELYVPVAKSGFINQSDNIVIQYDAYPYQHFGVATGKIQSISNSILTDNDESKPIHIGEPYYKITASLDKQTIFLYGKSRHLQQGMTCSAIIKGNRKKIWKWILDPIYRFSGEFWK